MPKLLVIGCGDIGIRTGLLLQAKGWDIAGTRRNPEQMPESFESITADYTTEDGLDNVRGVSADVVLFTPLPTSYDRAGYESGFRDGVAHIVASGALVNAKRFIMVSSTRAFAEQGGEWVDENSPTTTDDPQGAAIVAAETLARHTGIGTVVRASGLYGDGPGMLLRKVMEGRATSDGERFSNRIHRDDLGGLLAHLAEMAAASQPLPEIIVASDDHPTPIGEVERWLADQLGVTLSPEPPSRMARANRRCRNSAMHKLGYELRYPSYREGYSAVLTQLALAGN